MSDLKQRHDNRVPDLSKPSVSALSYLLRHQELWPAGFGPWNYADRCNCGIGLAMMQWPGAINPEHYGYAFAISLVLGISSISAQNIFLWGSGNYPGSGLMPEQMADMLDTVVSK